MRRIVVLLTAFAALAGAAPSAHAAGTLTVVMTDDVDFLDPGRTYYQVGFMAIFAMHRPLYTIDATNTQVPNLAAGPPEVAPDGRTVTVRIKPNVRFAPPVNRAATSKDVKYAIERAFFDTVNNGYAGAYFGDITGARVGVRPGTTIRGIETPDDQTITFRLDRATGATLARALILPITAPVPRSTALPKDRRNPSRYDMAQVATGPFRLQSYRPGRSITMTRNPNWDAATDTRQPNVDRIVMSMGHDDTDIASRRIVTGRRMVNGDFLPRPATLKRLRQSHASQISDMPSGGTRYIALNTTIPPLDKLDVRKAILAASNRKALRATRGSTGDIASHFLPPGIPGHAEAGGLGGTGDDFLATPAGNFALAQEYLKKAGYPSGKITDRKKLLVVGTKDGVAQKVAQLSARTLRRLGFNVRLRLVTQDAMYTRFCNVPRAKVAVCPNVGWFKDFNDPMTLLDPTFHGGSILREGNSNWSQLDVPEINRRLDAGRTIQDPAARAQEYGAIDRLITAQAPAVPWVWEKDILLRSANVTTPADPFTARFDLANARVG